MARYTWDVGSLQRCLNKIEKLIKRETDEVELAKLYHYYDEINTVIYDNFYYPAVNLPLYKKMPDMLSAYLSNQRYYNLLIPYNNALAKNSDLLDDVSEKRSAVSDQITKVTGAHVTKEKAISICYDFYKDFDPEFFEHFKRFYDMRFNHLRFIKPKEAEELNLDYLGSQNYLFGIDESFIEVVGNDNPDMSTTVIHEIGHAIDNSMNPNSYLSSDFFYEVVTIFMELVSFYKKAGNFDELFYYNSMFKNFKTYASMVSNAYTYSNLMQTYIDFNHYLCPEFYEQVRSEFKMSKKKTDDFLKSYRQKNIVYPVSLSLALSFFHIYKQDEKKGIENLKRFIKTNNRDEFIPLVLTEEFEEMVGDEFKTLMTESGECFARHAK